MRYLILALLLMSTLFLSNGSAQDYTTWGLPDGVKIRLGKGKISAVEFSPDGSQIAVASSVGIWLYDVQTGKELALLPGHREGFSTSVFSGVGGTLTINMLAFSPDGKMLASASEDGTLGLLDLTTYAKRHTLLENKEAFVNRLEGIPVIAMAFSADGKTLTTLEGIGERRIKVWDVDSGRLLSDISGRKGGAPLTKDDRSGLRVQASTDPVEHKRNVPLVAVALSPDGTTFVATESQIMIVNGVSDAAIRLGDVRTGDLRPTLVKILEHSTKQVDPPNSESIRSVRSVSNPIRGLGFSPDGTILAGVRPKTRITRQSGIVKHDVSTTRSEIQLWDVNTGNELSTVIPQQEVEGSDTHWFWRTLFVVFSPDSRMFATANQITAAVQLWEVSTGDLISTFTIPHPETAPPWDRRGAMDLTFSPDGKTLAIATAERHGSLQLWEVGTGKIISILADHPKLTALPVNDKAFIGLRIGSIQLRDINTGEILQDVTKAWMNLIEHIREIGGVEVFSISPDATTVALGSNDGSLQLWDLRTGNPFSTLTGHTGSVNALAFTADGTRLASGSKDRSIRLWDVSTGAQHLTLTEHINSGKELVYDTDDGIILPSAEFVNNLVFSPDGRTLASASELGTIWLWELNTGNLLTTVVEHEAGVNERSVGWDEKVGLAFSPSGTLLASGGMDGQVMLSEVSANPTPLIFKERHGWRVKVLVFSPDGKHFVSGSRDNSIRLWDVETGTKFAVLSGHLGEVNVLAFSADGRTLISGSIDGTVLLWDWEMISQPTNR